MADIGPVGTASALPSVCIIVQPGLARQHAALAAGGSVSSNLPSLRRPDHSIQTLSMSCKVGFAVAGLAQPVKGLVAGLVGVGAGEKTSRAATKWGLQKKTRDG